MPKILNQRSDVRT